MVMPQGKPIFQFILQLTSNQVIESINMTILIKKSMASLLMVLPACTMPYAYSDNVWALCKKGDTNNNVDCKGHARVYEYIE